MFVLLVTNDRPYNEGIEFFNCSDVVDLISFIECEDWIYNRPIDCFVIDENKYVIENISDQINILCDELNKKKINKQTIKTLKRELESKYKANDKLEFETMAFCENCKKFYEYSEKDLTNCFKTHYVLIDKEYEFEFKKKLDFDTDSD